MAGLGYVKPVLVALVIGSITLAISEYLRPSVLLVGNVTVDLVDKKPVLGGAVAYAAAVLSAFGVRACVVTAAGSDADLSAFWGHSLHLVPANATLTFEHTYTWWGNKRKLRVTAQPDVTLSMAHVPQRCRRARTVLLGPLTPQDLDSASFVTYRQGWMDRWMGFKQQVGLMAQGLQRGLDATGKVVPFKEPSPLLLDALSPHVSVFLSDVETDIWPSGTVANLTQQSARWLITRGELGADEFTHSGMHHFPPYKVEAVDTNGAGDTFATAYMLALSSRWPSPAAFANWAASRAVMMPQTCKPHCVKQGLHADSTFAKVSSFVSGQVRAAESGVKGLLHRAKSGLSEVAARRPVSLSQGTVQSVLTQLGMVNITTVNKRW